MKKLLVPIILICVIVVTIYTLYVCCQNVWIKPYIISQIEKNTPFSASVKSARINLDKLTVKDLELYTEGIKFLYAPKVNVYLQYKFPLTIQPATIYIYRPHIKLTQWPPKYFSSQKIKKIPFPIIAKNAYILVDDKVKNIKFSLQNTAISLYNEKITIFPSKLCLADITLKIAKASIFKSSAKVKLQKQTIPYTKSLQKYLQNLKFETLKIKAAELWLDNFEDLNIVNGCFEIHAIQANFYNSPIYIDKVRLSWHFDKIWGTVVYKDRPIKYAGTLDIHKKKLLFNIAPAKLNNIVTLPHFIMQDYTVSTEGYFSWENVPYAKIFLQTPEGLKAYVSWQKNKPTQITLNGSEITLQPKKDSLGVMVVVHNSDIYKLSSVELLQKLPYRVSGNLEISWPEIVGSLTFKEGPLKSIYINKVHNETNIKGETLNGGKFALTLREPHKFMASFDTVNLFGNQTFSGTAYGTWSSQTHYIHAIFPYISTDNFKVENLSIAFQYSQDKFSNIHISAIVPKYGQINMEGALNIKENLLTLDWIAAEKFNIKAYDAKIRFHTATASFSAKLNYKTLPTAELTGTLNLNIPQNSLIKCHWQKINITSLPYPFTKNLEGQIEISVHYSKNTTTFTLASPQIKLLADDLKVENVFLNGVINGKQIQGIVSEGKVEHYGFVGQIERLNFNIGPDYLYLCGSLSQKAKGKLTIERCTLKNKTIDLAVELKHFLILGKPTWANLTIHGTTSPAKLFVKIENTSIGDLKIDKPIVGLFVKEKESFIAASAEKSGISFYVKAKPEKERIIFEGVNFAGSGVSFCGSGQLSNEIVSVDLRDVVINLSNLPTDIDRTGTISGDIKITWNLQQRRLSVESKENLKVKVDDWLDGYVRIDCNIGLGETFNVFGNLKFVNTCFGYPRLSKYTTRYERDLLFIVDKNVRYRSSYLDVKLKPGSFLHITKQRGRPIFIVGELVSEGGTLEYLGRTFTIDKGVMYWQMNSIEPKVILHAHTTVDSKVVTLTYEGYLRGGVPQLHVAGLSDKQTIELIVPRGGELFGYGLKQLIFVPLEEVFFEPVVKPIKARLSKIIGGKVYIEVTPILAQFLQQTPRLPHQALQITLMKKKGNILYKFESKLNPSNLSILEDILSIEYLLGENRFVKYRYVNLKNKKEKYHEFSFWESFTF